MSINGIEVTDVIIFPVKGKNLVNSDTKLRAFARLVINDQFIISGIKVFEGNNGEYIRFPQELAENGKGYDICFPTTAELRNYMADQILSQYAIAINYV